MEVASIGSAAMERIISTVGELPASPAIVSSVMGMTSNLDTDVEQLGRVLSTDQALSAKVLKLSNSSFYGRSKGVGTLKEAILILGFYTLRSLVIASSTHGLYKSKDDNPVEKKLWEHSLATAMGCRIVSQKLRHPQVEETFIAGLLHDIGKLVLCQKLTDEYMRVYEEVEGKTSRFIDAESELLNFTHTEVASLLLAKWNFPNFLTGSICAHHSPEEIQPFEEVSDAPRDLHVAHILNFCNDIAKHIGCGFSDRKVEDLSSLHVARVAGWSGDDVGELVETLRTAYSEEKHLFED